MMKPSNRLMATLGYASAQWRSAEMTRSGGATAQYVFKYDEPDFKYKVVADLTPKKAIVTTSVVYGSDPPEVSTMTLAYSKDANVYPLTIGCPLDSHIYAFNEFSCTGEKELLMFFSKKSLDLWGDGTVGHVIGTALPNLDAIDFLYPCTKS